MPGSWIVEEGARLEGSRELDRSKVQAPCIFRAPEGGFRLFYTGVGPGRPFPRCQGYILSARSDDGLHFVPEPGFRVQPDPADPLMSLRVLAPSIVAIPQGGWRMYFEARGAATAPTSILSAVSSNQLDWQIEPGIRLAAPGGVGAPRVQRLPDGQWLLLAFESIHPDGGPASGPRLATHVISARSEDGLSFRRDAAPCLVDRQDSLDSAGITAAELLPGSQSTMVYSAWQDVAPGTMVPIHPSSDINGASDAATDFAAASIAADMSGYRSRILVAHTEDGVNWRRDGILIAGDGYGGSRLDTVHAEDMSVIALDDGRLRMYYAACDAHGVWRIASAISAPAEAIPESR